MRVIREHYLRDDIEHGIGAQLDKTPENKPNQYCSKSHWILPDTNVFLHNMDALEEEGFQNVIILQTVMVCFKTFPFEKSSFQTFRMRLNDGLDQITNG